MVFLAVHAAVGTLLILVEFVLERFGIGRLLRRELRRRAVGGAGLLRLRAAGGEADSGQ
jgi:hypothetical protein